MINKTAEETLDELCKHKAPRRQLGELLQQLRIELPKEPWNCRQCKQKTRCDFCAHQEKKNYFGEFLYDICCIEIGGSK